MALENNITGEIKIWEKIAPDMCTEIQQALEHSFSGC